MYTDSDLRGNQMNKIKELQGANMDIDLISENIGWNQVNCPWNEAEHTEEHRCAVKDTSICRYFCGIKYLDSVLCSYPYESKDTEAQRQFEMKQAKKKEKKCEH